MKTMIYSVNALLFGILHLCISCQQNASNRNQLQTQSTSKPRKLETLPRQSQKQVQGKTVEPSQAVCLISSRIDNADLKVEQIKSKAMLLVASRTGNDVADYTVSNARRVKTGWDVVVWPDPPVPGSHVLVKLSSAGELVAMFDGK